MCYYWGGLAISLIVFFAIFLPIGKSYSSLDLITDEELCIITGQAQQTDEGKDAKIFNATKGGKFNKDGNGYIREARRRRLACSIPIFNRWFDFW